MSLLSFFNLSEDKLKKLDQYFRFSFKISIRMIDELSEILFALDPRNVFVDSRYEWVIKFIHNKQLYFKYHNFLNTTLQEIMSRLKVDKRVARQALSEHIAKLQENRGHREFPLTPVRMSLITTISLYIENLPRFNKYDPDFIISLVYTKKNKLPSIKKFTRIFGIRPWKVYYGLKSIVITYSGYKMEIDQWQLPAQLLEPDQVFVFDAKDEELKELPVKTSEINIFAKNSTYYIHSKQKYPKINFLAEIHELPLRRTRSKISISEMLI